MTEDQDKNKKNIQTPDTHEDQVESETTFEESSAPNEYMDHEGIKGDRETADEFPAKNHEAAEYDASEPDPTFEHEQLAAPKTQGLELEVDHESLDVENTDSHDFSDDFDALADKYADTLSEEDFSQNEFDSLDTEVEEEFQDPFIDPDSPSIEEQLESIRKKEKEKAFRVNPNIGRNITIVFIVIALGYAAFVFFKPLDMIKDIVNGATDRQTQTPLLSYDERPVTPAQQEIDESLVLNTPRVPKAQTEIEVSEIEIATNPEPLAAPAPIELDNTEIPLPSASELEDLFPDIPEELSGFDDPTLAESADVFEGVVDQIPPQNTAEQQLGVLAENEIIESEPPASEALDLPVVDSFAQESADRVQEVETIQDPVTPDQPEEISSPIDITLNDKSDDASEETNVPEDISLYAGSPDVEPADADIDAKPQVSVKNSINVSPSQNTVIESIKIDVVEGDEDTIAIEEAPKIAVLSEDDLLKPVQEIEPVKMQAIPSPTAPIPGLKPATPDNQIAYVKESSQKSRRLPSSDSMSSQKTKAAISTRAINAMNDDQAPLVYPENEAALFEQQERDMLKTAREMNKPDTQRRDNVNTVTDDAISVNPVVPSVPVSPVQIDPVKPEQADNTSLAQPKDILSTSRAIGQETRVQRVDSKSRRVQRKSVAPEKTLGKDDYSAVSAQAQNYAQRGLYESAKQSYYIILDKNSQDSGALKGITNIILKADNEIALEELQTLRLAYGDSSIVLIQEGILLSRMNRPQMAIEALERARELDPFNPIILYNLASLFERMGQTGKALSFYKESLDKSDGFQGQEGFPVNAIEARIEMLERR